MSNEDRLQRRYEREKNARLQAEDILEQKSRELFEKNQALEKLSASLESQVVNRTKELLVARDEALAAAHAKSEFLANMSHELRTPMNGVLGMLTLMQGTQLGQQQSEYLTIAKSSGELLLSVINDILDFSKIEAGKMTLEDLVFDPRQMLFDVVSPLKFMADDKGIQLIEECDEKMPVAIWGDSTRLKQVVTNLVSNAVKFTDQGSVTVSMRPMASHYVIQVRDTGMGMDSGQLAHIFEAFGQGDSSITRTHGGTGLGLTITNRITQMMGGVVNVESELGLGSIFTVQIPLREASAEELESSEQIKEGLLFDQESVLLVEDNQVNQQIATHLLGEANLKVTLAENGKEAVEKIQRESFEVVLMDLQMPVMDGLEATREIRKLDSEVKDIPIIAMTAHASTEHIEECMEVGMNAHTTKPINVDVLLNTIAKWIHPSGLAQPPELKTIKEAGVESEVPSIPGINISDALQRIKGNTKLLKTLLTSFSQGNLGFKDEIQTYIDQENIQKVIVMFHTIKGSAANISAQHLSHQAALYEQLGKDGKLDDIRKGLDEFSQELIALCHSIDRVYSNHEEAERVNGPSLTDDEWKKTLAEVKHQVHQDFAVADDLIRDIADKGLDEEQKKLSDELLSLADSFDMDGIEQAISNSRWG
jgi:signal transduction histidine kinase/ActR/RegA family two-component response regulator